jgi:hypothetical protein
MENIYNDSELEDMFKFVKKNAADLSYYKNHKNKNFELSKIDSLKFKKNKEYNFKWIINSYEELIETYAVVATEKIVEFFKSTFQNVSTKVNRFTLEFLVKLFGKNILEEINGNYDINNIKRIIFINLAGEEKFRNTAYLIAKDHIANIASNSRLQYKSSWLNSLNSKAFALSIINHPILGTDKNYKARIERDYPEQYEAYMDASQKKWENCLDGERHRTYSELLRGESRACIPVKICEKDTHHRSYEEILSGEKRDCVPN